MNSENCAPRSLRDIEEEVLAEGREWTRRRLAEKLQQEAHRHGGVFPLSGQKARHRKKGVLHLRGVSGVVELKVWQGQEGRKGRWGCPIKEKWGSRPIRK